MRFGFHLLLMLATCAGASGAVDRDGQGGTTANDRIDMKIRTGPASVTNGPGVEDHRSGLDRCRGLDPEDRRSCELNVLQADRDRRDSFRAAVPTKSIPRGPKIELPSTRSPFDRR